MQIWDGFVTALCQGLKINDTYQNILVVSFYAVQISLLEYLSCLLYQVGNI